MVRKPVLNKRRFWICLILVFLSGILSGSIITVYGIRYTRSFPMPVEKTSRNIAVRVAHDFSLDEATKALLEQEVLRLGAEIGGHLVETRVSIEKSINQRQESIGALMPDDARKERWAREFRSYFPRLPYVPIPVESNR